MMLYSLASMPLIEALDQQDDEGEMCDANRHDQTEWRDRRAKRDRLDRTDATDRSGKRDSTDKTDGRGKTDKTDREAETDRTDKIDTTDKTDTAHATGKTKKRERKMNQLWYADDAAAFGSSQRLRESLSSLCHLGPEFGYHPNAGKSYLIVEHNERAEAERVFVGTEVQIVTHHFNLGGQIGDPTPCRREIGLQTQEWERGVTQLAQTAADDPQRMTDERSAKALTSLQSTSWRELKNESEVSCYQPYSCDPSAQKRGDCCPTCQVGRAVSPYP
eukprot:GHVN01007378.1.p1 GENE.GHVN01007378.1~~GHVN01007378.1.p1  ORF type:complete len:275 (+),score=55.58 GHVN01007378.1:1552-2376(+)